MRKKMKKQQNKKKTKQNKIQQLSEVQLLRLHATVHTSPLLYLRTCAR